MNKFIVLFFGVLSSNCIFASEYKPGWNAQNFYSEVSECKKAVVFPAASDYIKRGLERNHEKSSLLDEAISMTPTFDAVANATCFCALNELAKDKSYGDAKVEMNFQSYIQIPRCKEAMIKTMKSIKANPTALKLN